MEFMIPGVKWDYEWGGKPSEMRWYWLEGEEGEEERGYIIASALP